MTLFYPLSFCDKKGGVIFDLDRDCIFNRSSDFHPRIAKGGVCQFLCWLHSVGQNHFYVMLLLSQGCYFIQSLLFSYVLQEDSVKFLRKFISVPFQPSRRRGIPSGRSSVKASFIRTTRTFRPDAHQCLKASNSSRLHPSGRNGKSSGRSSEFEKNPAFKCICPDDVVIPSGCHSVFDKH